MFVFCFLFLFLLNKPIISIKDNDEVATTVILFDVWSKITIVISG